MNRTIRRAQTHSQAIDAAQNGAPHHIAQTTAPLFFFAVATALALLIAVDAHALSFDIEFRLSTSHVADPLDTYADLLADHATGALLASQTISGIDGVSSVAIASTDRDYSTLITTTFVAAVDGFYTFEMGTDWGQGGGYEAVHLGSGSVLETFSTDQDIWWANNWGNSDVLAMTLELVAGESYSLGWVGFEDCCGGAVTFRFSVNGSTPATLDDDNFDLFEIAGPTPVPEPGTAVQVGLGLALAGLARAGRRR